jgi:hypothetical protein
MLLVVVGSFLTIPWRDYCLSRLPRKFIQLCTNLSTPACYHSTSLSLSLSPSDNSPAWAGNNACAQWSALCLCHTAFTAPFRISRPLCCSRPCLVVSSSLKSPLVPCCATHDSHTATLASHIRVVPYFTSPHDPHRHLHLPGEVSAFNLPIQHADATDTPPRTRGSKDRQGGLLSNTLRMAYHFVIQSGGSNQSPVTNIT